MEDLVLTTPLGRIVLQLRADAAPQTVVHVAALVRAGGGPRLFYRSDFVIQCGLHGSGATSPLPPLRVNESSRRPRLSNLRGAAALAHFDTPDCGGSEIFVSLRANPHLDDAYGGFCVFAEVAQNDAASWAAVDAIAAAVAGGARPTVTSAIVPRG